MTTWRGLVAAESAVDESVIDVELSAHVAGEDLPVHEPWRIRTLAEADWCIQRVAESQELVQRYQHEVELWSHARQRAERAADWFELRLKEWGVEQRTSTPSRKSVQLAHGVVQTRSAGERVEVVDEQLALAWARTACPDAVRVSERFLVSEVDKCVQVVDVIVEWRATDKSTGECEFQPEADTVVFSAHAVAAVQERLGSGFVVEARTERRVVDALHESVPGLGVRPEHVTATVRPLGL